MLKRVDEAAEGCGPRVLLPDYFRLTPREGKKPPWTTVDAKDVPRGTGLAKLRFDTPRTRRRSSATN
jgi:hypothetical protein